MSQPPPDWQPGLRAALGSIVGDPALVGGTWWDCRPIAHEANVGTTAGLWRWQGKFQRTEGGLSWAMVQKRLRLATRSPRWPGEPEVSDRGYWRREADILGSGLLRDLDEHLRAPHIFTIHDIPDGVDIWMEDLGAPLSVEPEVGRIAAAARAVGRWQGRYLAGDIRLPDDEFLCRDFLSGYLKMHDGGPRIQRAWWDLPLARRYLDRSLETAFMRLDESRPRLLAALASLAHCLNHNDLWPKNLFAAGDETVLIDWAYAGRGSVGEDVGNLIPDSFFDVIFDVTQTDALRQAVTSAYLDGLSSAGWDGDSRLAEFGIAALAGLKYTWLLPYTLQRIAGGAIEHSATRQKTDADSLVAAIGAGLELCVRMGDDALRLADELGLAAN